MLSSVSVSSLSLIYWLFSSVLRSALSPNYTIHVRRYSSSSGFCSSDLAGTLGSSLGAARCSRAPFVSSHVSHLLREEGCFILFRHAFSRLSVLLLVW